MNEDYAVDPYKIPSLTIGPNLYQKLGEKFFNYLLLNWEEQKRNNECKVLYIGNEVSKAFTALAAAKNYYDTRPEEFKELRLIAPIPFSELEYRFKFDLTLPSHKMEFRPNREALVSKKKTESYQNLFYKKTLNHNRGKLIKADIDDDVHSFFTVADDDVKKPNLKLASLAQLASKKFSGKGLSPKMGNISAKGHNDGDANREGGGGGGGRRRRPKKNKRQRLYIDIPLLVHSGEEFSKWLENLSDDVTDLASFVIFSNDIIIPFRQQ